MKQRKLFSNLCFSVIVIINTLSSLNAEAPRNVSYRLPEAPDLDEYYTFIDELERVFNATQNEIVEMNHNEENQGVKLALEKISENAQKHRKEITTVWFTLGKPKTGKNFSKWLKVMSEENKKFEDEGTKIVACMKNFNMSLDGDDKVDDVMECLFKYNDQIGAQFNILYRQYSAYKSTVGKIVPEIRNCTNTENGIKNQNESIEACLRDLNQLKNKQLHSLLSAIPEQIEKIQIIVEKILPLAKQCFQIETPKFYDYLLKNKNLDVNKDC